MSERVLYKEYGIIMPPDVDERFNGECLNKRQQQQIAEHNSTRTIYAYNLIAAQIWEFMRYELDLKAMMPPVVIDRRTDSTLPLSYKDGKPYSWVVGVFNYSSTTTNLAKDCPICVPEDYEVRIYHENMMREIRTAFGKHPLGIEVILVVSEIFMHEFCHYWLLLEKYNATAKYTKDATSDLIDYLHCSDTTEMEYVTEDAAITLMTRYWLTNVYNLKDLGDPILGGPYDLWRRSIDDEYAIISLYLRNRQIINLDTVDKTTPELDEEYSRNEEQLMKLTKEYREEARPFALVD